MGNMSYCRFQNTVSELEDCVDAIADAGIDCLPEAEKRAASRMYELCASYVEMYESIEIGDEE